jgi:Holliday junction resolvase RusA-like endonuclease
MVRSKAKTGRVYLRPIKSDKAREWCEAAAWQIPRGARLGLGSANAPVSLVFHVFYKSRRPDLSVELVLDVLQKNGVISDDRHVYHYEAFKHFSKDKPGVRVEIYPFEVEHA